jgi:hypothetical protein
MAGNGDFSELEPRRRISDSAIITGGSIDGTPIGQSIASNIRGQTILALLGFSGPGTGLTDIPASGLADGSLTDGELLTLSGIDTGQTLQSQIDTKAPILRVFAPGTDDILIGTSSTTLGSGEFRLVVQQESPESQPGVYLRQYLTDDAEWVYSFNASYDNVAKEWSQDDGGLDSWAHRLYPGGVAIQKKLAGSPDWNDAAWDSQDTWSGAFLESATTRTYQFRYWFSNQSVGAYIGADITFPVWFPSTPTSFSFSVTNFTGVNTATLHAWDTTQQGCGWGVLTTAAAGWIAGTLTVGF